MTCCVTVDVIVPASPLASVDTVVTSAAPPPTIDVITGGTGAGGIPDAPATGDIYGRVNNTWQPIDYTTLPVEVQLVPVSFMLPGMIDTGTTSNVPMAMPLTIPPNLTGTVAFAGVEPTADATFTLNQLSNGIVTGLGFISIGPTNNNAVAGPGGTLAIGDVLQLVTPTTADATLADVGITVLAQRVGGIG